MAGPLPPPAGGISIHIQRLAHLLQKDFSIDFIDEASTVKPGIFHVRSLNPFAYINKVRSCQVFFIHSGSRILKKIHILAGRILGKKVIITLHGYGNRRAWPFRAIDKTFFQLAHKVILVNPGIAQRVQVPAEKTEVMHAFVPPVMESEPALPGHVQQLIQQAKNDGACIICANASRLDVNNGEDLYGLDMSIKLTSDLKKAGFRVCFLFVLTSLEKSQEAYTKYLEEIKNESLDDSFHLLQTNLSFVRLADASDMVLRPTNADGDALTVREALYMNKIVLASDVVSRPEGTRLFKTRDQSDLFTQAQKLITELKNKQEQNTNISPEQADAYKNWYVTLINQVANEP